RLAGPRPNTCRNVRNSRWCPVRTGRPHPRRPAVRRWLPAPPRPPPAKQDGIEADAGIQIVNIDVNVKTFHQDDLRLGLGAHTGAQEAVSSPQHFSVRKPSNAFMRV